MEDIDEGEGACRFGKNLEKVDRGKRKPYKGYAFGGLFEDKCDNYWCKTKEHAQRVEFAEKNVILYPNNEEPGKFCYIKSTQIRVIKYLNVIIYILHL